MNLKRLFILIVCVVAIVDYACDPFGYYYSTGRDTIKTFDDRQRYQLLAGGSENEIDLFDEKRINGSLAARIIIYFFDGTNIFTISDDRKKPNEGTYILYTEGNIVRTLVRYTVVDTKTHRFMRYKTMNEVPEIYKKVFLKLEADLKQKSKG